jgi:hypothetical protein
MGSGSGAAQPKSTIIAQDVTARRIATILAIIGDEKMTDRLHFLHPAVKLDSYLATRVPQED